MTLSIAQRINCESLSERADVARIFNIQRYSLNDGRGIRTVVFFKGCPHSCPWCANPESISAKIEVVRRERKCLHCAACSGSVAECPSGAMEQIGRDVTQAELLAEVLKDEVFFRASSGGVTLSGGEVLMQATFAGAFLRQLRTLGINTAIETAGDCAPRRFLSLAQHCDDVLFDLKIMDAAQAKRLLNMDLDRVLGNLRLLVAEGIHVIPRLPLIPGFTLSEENFRQALDVVHDLKLKEIHLLPFHRYGEPKYRLLNQRWALEDVQPPSKDEVDRLRALAENAGFRVIIGG